MIGKKKKKKILNQCNRILNVCFLLYVFSFYSVDIEYNVERQITNIYGVVADEAAYERIDHCYFEDNRKQYITGVKMNILDFFF